MRTKRKNYKYDSSDYENGDYSNEDFEGDDDDYGEEDQVDDSAADSDYDRSNDPLKKNAGAKKASRQKSAREQEEENDESYEDEDPFSPEIDQILADRQLELPPGQVSTQQNVSTGRPQRSAGNQQQAKVQNWYLVKFTDQSYLHVKWIEESQLEEYSYRAKQKIRRYFNAKEKKRFLQDQLQRQAITIKPQKTHHFSDDDEEEEEDEEDAAIKGIPLPILPMPSDEVAEFQEALPPRIKVEAPDGEDLTQHFDKNYTVVERILSTTLLFPVIHPRQAKQIRGKWQDDCLKVVNVLANMRKNNVPIGLAFTEQLDAEKMYQQPQDFWNDLGLVFKNCRTYHKSIKKGLRKQCDALRCLAYHLYNDWYQEQKQRFVTGIALPPTQDPPIQAQTEQSRTQPSQQQSQNQNGGSQTQPKKDSTIVNLSSLLRSQQSGNDVQKKQTEGQQQQQQQVNPPAPQIAQPSIPPQIQTPQQQPYQQQKFQQPSMNSNPMQQPPQMPSRQGMENWNFTQQQLGQIQQQPIDSMQSQSNFQAPQPPSLPSLNMIMNPMGGQMQNQQNQLMDQMQMQLQQQMNQGIFPNSNQQMMQPNFMGQDLMNQMAGLNQNQQLDWNQQQLLKQLQNQNSMDMQGNMLQLPSMNQLQQQMMQQQLGNQFGQRQDQQQQMMDMNNINMIQSLQQQQDKNVNFLQQMIAQGMNPQMVTPELMAMMQMTGQDMNQFGMGRQPFAMPGQGNLPSFQLPSLQQTMGNFGLPSFNQMGQMGFNSQMSTFDPFGMSMMGMMGNPNNIMSQMLQQQQNMMKLPGFSSTMGTGNAFDEMSMMLNGLGQQQQTLAGMNPSFNPFGQPDFSQNSLMNFGSQQLPGLSSMMGQNPMRSNQFCGQFQPPRNIDPNLIQPDNLDQYNDKQQDPPVPPCIMDPGAYDLSWLLEPGETPQDLQSSPYLTQQEIEYAVRNKSFVDQLYLVKWKSLSYAQTTWEPESLFKHVFEDRIQEYNRFNRSLDQFQRDRLDQLIKNHKKMLRVTEKKYQNKKMDPSQEAFLALQEAKINRQLLNAKIQEIMGDAFYSFIQYSEKPGGVVPTFKKPTQRLKDYQLIGLNWLIRAWHEHRNVVLADEMGLGKTIMTLSLFDHLNKVYKLRGPYLILAPLTTLEHWKKIADEWTTLNSILYYDPNSAEGRSEIRYWEWFYTDVTYKGQVTQKSELYKFNIIITSFEVFMQDLNPILQEIPFIYIVVDEAHRLKNKQAKTLKLLKDHPCKRILLLTGTPVQNNTKELWTLLNYIEPEKFNSVDNFLEQYGNLETYEQIQKLHTILKPHFLRRLKEEVDNSIPPLQETVIEVGLTTLQSTYYKGIYGENRMMLAKFGTNSIKSSQLNNIDVQLRKCCNHLFLLKGVEEELTKDCKSDEDAYKKLLESSGKLMLLDKFIEKFKEENHKMLIFSQFKRMLDIIEYYLKMKAVPYEKLTGSVKTQDRINAIQRFNDDKTFGVFLLTTRAGGLGINLTSARVVIIFDSDWNPQNDLQAIARAHRIGQKFEVQVYRLITSKTYEEQMFERASKKLGMEQALFSKGAFHQDDMELTSLHLKGLTELKQDSKEIENLLKYGAYAFIDGDGEDNDQVNFNKDIDEILATGKKKEFTYSKGLYTLQKSTFNASKYENLPDVNDPDFWNKVLPFESIISISVLEKKFKKEKKEMGKNEKLQKEFFKDLEIVFNDFMDAKFDVKTSNASKKQLEADEEKLREILKKMIKLSGVKLLYVEKCKEWLRDMLRTNKRKKPSHFMRDQDSGAEQDLYAGEEDDGDQQVEEDDIILYDSDEQVGNRNLRKRNPIPTSQKEPNEEGQQPYQGKKRGRKPKNQQQTQFQSKPSGSFDESEGLDEEDEDDDNYGDEEEKDYESGKHGRKQDDSEEEPESRYGLRVARKRQKTGRDENYASSSQLMYQNPQGKSGSKVNEQIAKRNEKNGIVCAHCLHPDSQTNPCTYFCNSYCQRYFHEDCKEALFSSEPKAQLQKTGQPWQCNDCLDNKAVCFCCKEKGQILLFPKKGKPKAAGSFDNQQPSFILEEEDLADDDMFMDQQQEDEGGKIDDEDAEGGEDNINDNEDLEIDIDEDEEEVLKDESIKVEDKNLGEEQETQQDQQPDQSETMINDQAEQLALDIEDQDKPQNDQETKKEELQPALVKDTSTKIVLSLAREPMSQDQKTPMKSLNGVNQSDAKPVDKRFVVRCTLGGCFKYYHVDCVYQNKNVSCINSMKVQRFRCPLHYCEICQASGDSVLIVQCVKCPTAYHLKCLPQDTKAIRLTKKYIICGKHNQSQDDFPKYEEKPSQLYKQGQISTMSLVQQSGVQGSNTMTQQKSDKKKRQRKRGRKPKYSAAYDNGEESGEYDPGEDAQEYPTPSQHNVQLKRELFSSRQPSSVIIKIGDDSQKKIPKQPPSESSSIRNESQTPKPLFAVIRGPARQISGKDFQQQ